jgi:hypothetical protein
LALSNKFRDLFPDSLCTYGVLILSLKVGLFIYKIWGLLGLLGLFILISFLGLISFNFFLISILFLGLLVLSLKTMLVRVLTMLLYDTIVLLLKTVLLSIPSHLELFILNLFLLNYGFSSYFLFNSSSLFAITV